MSRQSFLEALSERILVQDGAKGTGLQARGLPRGYLPDAWNLERPEVVLGVHADYVKAGADIVVTNTFGSIRPMLEQYGLGDKVVEINQQAVRLARQACGRDVFVAASIPPIGHYLEPIGPLSFDDAVSSYAEQVIALEEAGVDVYNLETASDLRETKAALLAIRKNSNKPVVAMMSFGDDGRTLLGTTPQAAAIVIEAMGADVIGANCSTGIQEIYDVLAAMSQVSGLPKACQPNAGLPVETQSGLMYPQGPEVYVQYVERLIEVRVGILGGCCGTTPEHIRAIRRRLDELGQLARPTHSAPWLTGGTTWLASRTAHLGLGSKHPVAIIGERINPTQRGFLKRALLDRDMSPILAEAEAQGQSGAHLIDVNVGIGANESPDLMAAAVNALEQVVTMPLVLDSADAEVLRAGLTRSAGKVLVNSVTAKEQHLEQVLPVIRKSGAAVIGMCMDEQGVGETAAQRVVAAQKILRACQQHQIAVNDVIIDPGLISVAAMPGQMSEVLESLVRLKERLKVNTCVGLSNISHGLPGRPTLNAAFLAMATKAGLDAVILDPQQERVVSILRASQVLTGRDAKAANYIEANRSLGRVDREHPVDPDDPLAAMGQVLIHGEGIKLLTLVQQALDQHVEPKRIVDDGLLPGMDELGRRFKERLVFLPQVMAAAEAMLGALNMLRPVLEKTGFDLGPVIVFATVEGDVHDIGKNIVAAILRSGGFQVLDLGKSVPAHKIVSQAKQADASLICLSALMTTTMRKMEEVVSLTHSEIPGLDVLVGGAVVTEEYASAIGAAYAPDAISGLQMVRKLLENKLSASQMRMKE